MVCPVRINLHLVQRVSQRVSMLAFGLSAALLFLLASSLAEARSGSRENSSPAANSRQTSSTAPTAAGTAASGGTANALGDSKDRGAAVARPGPAPDRKNSPDPLEAPAANAPKNPMSLDDRSMLRKLAQAHLAESKMAGLATALSGTPAVRRYAEKMLEVHLAANDELRQIASDYRVIVPGGLEKEQAAVLHELALKTGEEFDRLYLSEAGQKSHRELQRLFDETSRSAKTPELKSYAARFLPAIEQHGRIAAQMQADPQGALQMVESFMSAGQTTAVPSSQGASGNRRQRNGAIAGTSRIAASTSASGASAGANTSAGAAGGSAVDNKATSGTPPAPPPANSGK